MGATGNIKEPTFEDLSQSNFRRSDLMIKKTSQYRDFYANYHLLENRWTTIRSYQKLPETVNRNFQKILNRGISNSTENTKIAHREDKKNPNSNLDNLKPSLKLQLNDNFFFSQEEFSLNKVKMMNLDSSIESNK